MTDTVLFGLLDAAGLQPRRCGDEWASRCPAHKDRRPSLSARVAADGRLLLHCFAGCDFRSIFVALGLHDPTNPAWRFSAPGPRSATNPAPPAAFTRPSFPTAEDAAAALRRHYGEPAASWSYHDPAGAHVGMVLRWNTPTGKIIRPVSRVGGGRWAIAAMLEPRPLYKLETLASAAMVFIAEGEKSVEALRAVGLTATTSAGGSNGARLTDWTPLRRASTLVVLPDNDAAGMNYAKTVLALLGSHPDKRLVRLPGLAEGEDVVDYLERGGTREALEWLVSRGARA